MIVYIVQTLLNLKDNPEMRTSLFFLIMTLPRSFNQDAFSYPNGVGKEEVPLHTYVHCTYMYMYKIEPAYILYTCTCTCTSDVTLYPHLS